MGREAARDARGRVVAAGAVAAPPAPAARREGTTRVGAGRRGPGTPFWWLSLAGLALKRLWNDRWLALAAVAGLAIAIAMVASVPIFGRGVNLILLRSEMGAQAAQSGRPLFAMRFYHTSGTNEPYVREDYNRLDGYVLGSASAEMGLPTRFIVRWVESITMGLVNTDPRLYPAGQVYLEQIRIGYMSGIEEHANVYEGSVPAAVGADAPEVPVMIVDTIANKIGLHAGERYILQASGSPATGGQTVNIPIAITGVFKAEREGDPFWFNPASSLLTTFFVPESTYWDRIAPLFKDQAAFASWYLVFDENSVRTDDVPILLERTALMLNRANTIARGTRLDYSQNNALENYRQRTEVLTVLLYLFSVPIVGLVLYFVGLVSGLMSERRRGEVATLASRGAGRRHLVLLQLVEGLLLGLVALPMGLVLAGGVALAMGATLSFLVWVPREPLPIAYNVASLRFALAAVALGILIQVAPTIGSAFQTIVRYKQERARSLRTPLWQRMFLDVLLLAITVYALYTLRQRGSLSVLGGASGDPFREPILFAAPMFFILALALISIRLFPYFMRLLAWATGYIRAAALPLVFRYLARVPGQYSGPLLLIILTLSMAVFTASMARTLDQNIFDQVYYGVGTDIAIYEKPQEPQQQPGAAPMSPEQRAQWDVELGGYFLPVSEQEKIPGVRAAARVTEYTAKVTLGTGLSQARLLAIDRLDFPRVAFFRRDFAREPLIGLMNQLARSNAAVLVPTGFLGRVGLQVGDYLPVQVSVYSGEKTVDLTVAGTYNYFPTAYPNKPPTLIANREYLSDSTGEIAPHYVWFAVEPWARTVDIQQGVRDMDLPVAFTADARANLTKQYERPERVGVFGMLSVGFLAAAVLTTLGFALHAIASFQRQVVELGVLRAIGLSYRQMMAFLVAEQATIILSGALAGLALGTAATLLFIPFFRVGQTADAIVPPFRVLLAWDDVAKILVGFAGILLVTSAFIIWRAARMRIAEAVKLGDTG